MKIRNVTGDSLAGQIGKTIATLALLLAAFVPLASANCGPASDSRQKSPRFAPPPGRPLLTPISYKLRPSAGDRDEDRGDDSSGEASIVGMWNVVFTAKGNENNPAPFNPPDGAQLDNGYVQWHSDGTEIMNSDRDPATGNFCMGVWKQTGPNTFRLNHFALSWDATGTSCPPSQQPGATGCFQGLTRIHQEVTVDRSGNHYHGSLVIDQYDPSGMHVVGQLTGTISADRITAN